MSTATVVDTASPCPLDKPPSISGQLCGWAAYDAGQQGLAQRYYIGALRAAHSADDRPLGAYILGCMAEQVARQGRPAEAVTLIETALAGTRGWQTPRLLAQLYNWQAWIFATLQEPSACTAAISRARTQAEQFQLDSDPAWLYWVNSADINADHNPMPPRWTSANDAGPADQHAIAPRPTYAAP